MILLKILCIICGIMILRSKGQKRFNWCICSMLLLSSDIVLSEKPQVLAHRFFILCFWASVIYRKEYKHVKSPFTIVLIIYAIGFYIIGYHAQALSPFSKVWKPTAALLDSYLVLPLMFWGTKNITVKTKPIIWSLYIMTIFGFITLAIHDNPYRDLFNTSPDMAWISSYYFGDRTRITSTWSHPITYGFICTLFFYMLVPYMKERKIKILLLFLFGSVMICGSRTVLFAFMLLGALYILLCYKVTKAIGIGAIALLLGSLSYLTVPIIHDKVEDVVATATGSSDTGGSSLDMRDEQLDASLFIFSSAPIYGHGPDYVQEQIMPNQQIYWQEGLNLYGFESYLYILLIERGVVGIVMEILVSLALLLYGFRNRRKYKKSAGTIISIWLTFIFFSLSTGVMGTMTMSLIFIGIMMRRIEDQRQQRIIAINK